MNSETIKKIVSDHFGVSIVDMESNKRDNEIAVARQFAIAFTREGTNLSLKAIGKLFKRDHSTIIHSLSCVENMKQDHNPKYLRDYLAIKEKLYPGSLEERLIRLERMYMKMEKLNSISKWEKRLSA